MLQFYIHEMPKDFVIWTKPGIEDRTARSEAPILSSQHVHLIIIAETLALRLIDL